MEEHLIFNGKRYAPSTAAAVKAGYTNDYVARLCRQGKVLGRMVGKTWYVEENSFFRFLVDANKRKQTRKKELSTERKAEYVEAPKIPPSDKAKAAIPSREEREWDSRARRVLESRQRKRRSISPERVLALTFSIALVLATPAMLQTFARGFEVFAENSVMKRTVSTLALAQYSFARSAAVSSATSALESVALAEAGAMREAGEGIAFQFNAKFSSAFSSISSLAPQGRYAAVLQAVADSETISLSLNVRELKNMFSMTLSFLRGKLERLLQ